MSQKPTTTASPGEPGEAELTVTEFARMTGYSEGHVSRMKNHDGVRLTVAKAREARDQRDGRRGASDDAPSPVTKYRLTLEVIQEGEVEARFMDSVVDRGIFDSEELTESDLLATLVQSVFAAEFQGNACPEAFLMILARRICRQEGPIKQMAHQWARWKGGHDFKDCVRIVADEAKLTKSCEDEE